MVEILANPFRSTSPAYIPQGVRRQNGGPIRAVDNAFRDVMTYDFLGRNRVRAYDLNGQGQGSNAVTISGVRSRGWEGTRAQLRDGLLVATCVLCSCRVRRETCSTLPSVLFFEGVSAIKSNGVPSMNTLYGLTCLFVRHRLLRRT